MRGGLDEWCDLRANQKQLTLQHHRIRIHDIGATSADGFQLQPCRPGQQIFLPRLYSRWAHLFRAMVPPPFGLSPWHSSCSFRYSRRFVHAAGRSACLDLSMPVIQRSALVEHSAAHMFALVNDVDAYPSRFEWCHQAQVMESSELRVLARLELGIAGFHTWFITENQLSPPHHIDMALRDDVSAVAGALEDFMHWMSVRAKSCCAWILNRKVGCWGRLWPLECKAWPIAWWMTSCAKRTKVHADASAVVAGLAQACRQHAG